MNAEIIQFYRSRGFLRGLTNEKAARELEAEWGSAIPEREIDLFVLALDRERVLCRDLECDALEGNNEYARWAVDIGRIAGLDVEASERWELDRSDGRVVVEMRIGRRKVTARALGAGDYLHAEPLVDAIARHMRGPETLFTASDGWQGIVIVRATKATIRELERERGWTFRAPGSRVGPRHQTGRRVRAWLRARWDAFWWPFRTNL